MKIAYVSTYPPKACGIASYTDILSLAVAVQEDTESVCVISERSGRSTHREVEVVPCFGCNEDFVSDVMNAVNEIQPDIVHLQHAPDILGMDHRIFDLMKVLADKAIRRVVTPHTIYDFRSGLIERKPLAPIFNKRLGANSDAIITHQTSMIETLARHGVDRKKVHLIPHWTGPMPEGDVQAIRNRNGLAADHKLLLFFGFIHVQKNIHTPVKAMLRVLNEVPEARLVIAGSIAGNSWYNRLYTRYLKRLIEKNDLQGKVILDKRFIPDADMNAYYAAADLILLPHLQGYGSASGVAHQALAARKALLCSDVPKFEEIGQRISKELVVSANSADAWSDSIVKVLRKSADSSLQDKIRAYAKETSIEATAANHVRLYRELLARP